MRQMLLIAKRELMVRVRRKSFIVSTFLVPLFFAGMGIVPVVLVNMDSGTESRIGVIDASGRVAAGLTDSQNVKFTVLKGMKPSDVQAVMADPAFTGVLTIDSGAVETAKNITLYVRKSPSLELTAKIEGRLAESISEQRLQQYDIPDLKEVVERLRVSVQMKSITLKDDGSEEESSATVTTVIAYILGFLAYFLIMVSAQMVMNGVVEEKSSRIVEVLASSVRSFDLMMGKILGIVSVFLLQALLWVVLTFIIIGIAIPIIGVTMMKEASAAASSLGGDAGITGMFGEVGGQVLAPLANVNFAAIIGTFIFFFLFGYLLYASIFAAVGSAVEDPSDTGQLMLPITAPLLLAMLCMLMAMKTPDGPVAFWFSLIPFTSPVVMPVRMTYGVPAWQLIVSGIILVGSFIGMTWLSARVYRRGVLMYGKNFGWKDIWRWTKG
ncbi:MAG: ABC transporter permease [Bacteroides sp.]